MREITDHKTNPANDELKVIAVDEPGSGGAHHLYECSAPGLEHFIRFQNGPIKEAGVNGITHEVLLAIIIDRLRCFQAGPYANGMNDSALNACTIALECLKMRTKEREARGVEGTHKV